MANLRFDHRHGGIPLPTQLQPDQISQELAALLWRLFYDGMTEDCRISTYGHDLVGSNWESMLRRWHVTIEHKRADLFNNEFEKCADRVRSIIYDEGWLGLYTFLEFFFADQSFRHYIRHVSAILQYARAAWRIVDNQFVPISSPEQAESVIGAIQVVHDLGPDGAKEHLRKASAVIADSRWGESVRESISAVESVARTLGNAGSLSEALTNLQSAGHHIHPALAKGLKNLYG